MGLQLSFDITGISTFVGWIFLCAAIFLPNTSSWHKKLMFLAGRLIPIFLVVWFVSAGFAVRAMEPTGDMYTLEGMLARFSVPERLLVLWIEILAYDLLLGRWIAEDALTRGWTPLFILPLLPLTFIRGPLGLLVYLTLVGLNTTFSRLRRLSS